MQVEYIREEFEELKYDVKPDPKSLGEFLFWSSSTPSFGGNKNVNLKVGEEVFLKYAKILANSYILLKENYWKFYLIVV